MDGTRLITLKEAASILSVSIPTIYELANSKNFPVVIINETPAKKTYRVNYAKLMKWIEKGGIA